MPSGSVPAVRLPDRPGLDPMPLRPFRPVATCTERLTNLPRCLYPLGAVKPADVRGAMPTMTISSDDDDRHERGEQGDAVHGSRSPALRTDSPTT
jgi:hypothetical protein